MKKWVSPVAVAGYVGTVVAANALTATQGMWSVGFGLAATAGTVFAGASFVLRDVVQDAGGRGLTLVALAVGAGLSAVMSTPTLALASAGAFALGELLDMAVYTRLRARGWVRAALTSNLMGAVLDTFAFLLIAGFPVTVESVAGQLDGKAWATAAVVAPVLVYRAVRRRRAVSDNTVRA